MREVRLADLVTGRGERGEGDGGVGSGGGGRILLPEGSLATEGEQHAARLGAGDRAAGGRCACPYGRSHAVPAESLAGSFAACGVERAREAVAPPLAGDGFVEGDRAQRVPRRLLLVKRCQGVDRLQRRFGEICGQGGAPAAGERARTAERAVAPPLVEACMRAEGLDRVVERDRTGVWAWPRDLDAPLPEGNLDLAEPEGSLRGDRLARAFAHAAILASVTPPSAALMDAPPRAAAYCPRPRRSGAGGFEMGRFQRTQVGAAEIIALQDSWTAMPPAAFYPDVPAGAWDAYGEFLDENGNLTLNFGAWLVVSGGRTILVDTGLGGRPAPMPLREAPALPSVMEAAGVRPGDVDTVVYTHLHFDHTGWTTIDEDGASALLFPNARHVVQRTEWEYWTGSDELRGAAQYDTVLAPVEAAGLLDLVEGEHAVTAEVVTVPTPGHTPGHVSFVVASGSERAYLIGDAAHQPVQVREDGWCAGADVDKTASAASRAALFARIEREGALIASGHFPFPGLGHAVAEVGGRVFRPFAEG